MSWEFVLKHYLKISGLLIITGMLVLAIARCSGGGSDNNVGTAPSISNFSFSPTAVYVNEGGGQTSIIGNFDFYDADGNLKSAVLTVLNSGGSTVIIETIDIANVSGLTTGTIQGSVTVSTTVSGDYTVQIYVTDTAGLRSNTLEQGFLISEFPWVSKTPMPTKQPGFSTASINGLVYVIGGVDATSPVIPAPAIDMVQVYNPATDKWSAGPSLPIAVSGPMTVSANGKIYAIGGMAGSFSTDITDSVQEFDPMTQMWTLKNDMPDQRVSAATATRNGIIYIITGSGPGIEYDSLLWYDTTKDTWGAGSPMSSSRTGAGGAAINDNILVYGGYSSTHVPDAGYLRSLESYNPAMDTWMSKADGQPRRGFGVTVFNNLMYVFGGSNWEGALDWADTYDSSKDQWISKTSMPLNLSSAHAETVGDKIYVFGTDATLEYNSSNDIK
ncbi:MAG: kelch repeat-containing protein [Gammaproteobacteria bacterium]|jgi:N-acetylneuraminic acid mutarotase